MRQLFPAVVDDVDLYDAYSPASSDPVLRLNMVMSADGHATDREGRSGGLSSPMDRTVFRTLRALADGILVGAGTARKEGYGPHRIPDALRRRRIADGRTTPAAIVLVSRSLQMDYDSALFREAEVPTIMLTCESAPAEAQRKAAEAGVVVVAGDDDVDLKLGVAVLRQQFGLAHILCEGGPSLNAALLDAGLVDELCLTLSPTLVGHEAPSLTAPTESARPLVLHSMREHEGELFLRYRVRKV